MVQKLVVDVLVGVVLVTTTVMILHIQLHPQRHHYGTDAFVPFKISSHPKQQLRYQQHHRRTTLHENKPQRLDENVDGVVYVNDRVS